MPTPMEQRWLDAQARAIAALNEQALVAHRRSLESYIQAGERLRQVKAALPHTEFLPWVREHLQFTERHAQRLMYLARNATRVSHLDPETSLREAVERVVCELRAPIASAGPSGYTGPLPAGVRLDVADATRLPLPDQAVDLFVCSPPYNLGVGYDPSVDDDAPLDDYLEEMSVVTRELHRVGGPQARLCINVPIDTWRRGPVPLSALWTRLVLDAVPRQEHPWQYAATILWTKAEGGQQGRSTARGSRDSASAVRIMAPVENVLVFHKGDWNLGRSDERGDFTHEEWLEWTRGWWLIPNPGRSEYPATFPPELPRRCMKLLSFADGVVCDPFVGSGTSALVAAELGRQFHGFDINERAIELARARVGGMTA